MVVNIQYTQWLNFTLTRTYDTEVTFPISMNSIFIGIGNQCDPNAGSNVSSYCAAFNSYTSTDAKICIRDGAVVSHNIGFVILGY